MGPEHASKSNRNTSYMKSPDRRGLSFLKGLEIADMCQEVSLPRRILESALNANLIPFPASGSSS